MAATPDHIHGWDEEDGEMTTKGTLEMIHNLQEQIINLEEQIEIHRCCSCSRIHALENKIKDIIKVTLN